mgnify:CR=1 FL=1|tara:strand:+ start:777 stop:1088 length:312 start_codon:yes stop_codon:yes gene_type:complete
MDIKKYTHKVKVFRDRWLKEPKEVDISLPYVPEKFTRPDEVVESFHIDWEEQRLVQKTDLIKGDKIASEKIKKESEKLGTFVKRSSFGGLYWNISERKKKGSN